MSRSVNATTRNFEASTTNMTFARFILAAAVVESLPAMPSQQLPMKSVTMVLAQYYLDNVFVLYPSFSETYLFNAIERVYEDASPRIMGQGAKATPFDHWLLFMCLAVAALNQSRSHGDLHYADGVRYVTRALQFKDDVLVPGSISFIQALILFVQYSMLDPEHFDSWHLVGFAGRAVIDLGFHQDPPRQQQPSHKELEIRRRVYWCFYTLDRLVPLAFHA